MGFNLAFKGLNAELNPICHLLTLLGAHHIFHVSGLRVKNPAVARLVEIFIAIYLTQRFVTVFTTARQFSLTRGNALHSTTSLSTSWRTILILCYRRLGLQSGLLTGFPTPNLILLFPLQLLTASFNGQRRIGYRLDGPGSNPGTDSRFASSPKRPYRLWGPHTNQLNLYPGSFRVLKQSERDGDRSPPSSDEVKNEWSYTSSSPIIFMTWTGKSLFLLANY